MTSLDVTRAADLFLRAIELDLERRAAFLARECGEDAELRAEVERLLKNDAEVPEAFLRGGRVRATYLEPGSVVGDYEILDTIGEGGMGTVYAAQQASPSRRVALKVIRPGRMSSEALRRFRHEAEVLGSLHHPGITQVFEAGTASVRSQRGAELELPYLAMELVRGAPLLEFAEEHQLDVRARLELIARLCDAVHHAHQRGVIHRDLKPENVLVTVEESTTVVAKRSKQYFVGQPKILDFGIARVVDADRTTLETRLGQIIGTLTAMSPEQVAGDAREVDVRTDVYALGVILYQLLAKRPPLDLQGCTMPEAAARIREEEPPLLSTWTPAFRGDVSVIAAKALHKDKDRRYQSAAELAADLRRHQKGEAIEARADSALYVLGKTLRRHRGPAVGGFLFLLLLTAFAVVSGIQAERNRRLAASVEDQLAVSNIERGRLLGRADNLLGESLLWRAFLQDPESPQSFWALWEFFERHPRLATVAAHEEVVDVIEYLPDGKSLATGSADGSVKLWRAESFEELAHLREAPAGVYALDAAADGTSLAAGCLDGTIVVWDLSTLQPLATLRGHQKRVTSLDHHPDGGFLASAGDNEVIRIWELSSGECVSVFDDAQPGLWAVRYSPDGSLLAAGARDTIVLRSVTSGTTTATLNGHSGGVFSLAFSEDGRRLYSGGADRRILVWDVQTRALEHELRPVLGPVHKLWVRGDGSTLHTLGRRRLETFRRPALERVTALPLDHFSRGASSSISDDRMVIGTQGGSLRVWDLTANGRRRLSGHKGRAVACLFPDAQRVATSDELGDVLIWDVRTGTLLRTLEGHAGPVCTLRFDPAGSLLATGGKDGTLRLWDTATWSCVRVVEGFSAWTDQGVDFSPDGRLLAAACEDATFRVWSVKDWSEDLTLHTERESLLARFTPDGRGLATVSRGYPTRVTLWSLEGEQRAQFESPVGTPWNVDFSRDGSRLFSGTWNHEIRIWDTASASQAGALFGHSDLVRSLELSPRDPDLLVSGSNDGTVRFWSLSLGRNVATLTPFDGADVISIDFSDDGRTLAVAGEHPDVYLLDLEYFERHMAGNLRHQLEALGPEIEDLPRERLERWQADVFARPWPRW